MVFVVTDTITVETVLQQVTRTIPELRFMRKFMNISGIESSSYEDVTLKRFEGPINLRHEVLESEDFAFQISCITYPSLYTCLLEELLPGGHGLMVRGYLPVIHTLAKGIDICLGYR